MQVCTALSLHQPSAHPGLSLPGYPVTESVQAEWSMELFSSYFMFLFYKLSGKKGEHTANEGRARVRCRRDKMGELPPGQCRQGQGRAVGVWGRGGQC